MDLLKKYLKFLCTFCLSVFLLLSMTDLAKAEPIEIPDLNSNWLDQLNYYRLSSGLSPVTESPEYSKAAEAHAKYLSETDPSLFVGNYLNKHSENPASPYATKEGITIGAGNISWSSTPGLAKAVDGLMTAPIHAIGFLRENLTKVGAAELWSKNDNLYVQTFSMISGMKTTPRTKIVLFPGNGATVKINGFTAENPEPRESCSGKYSDWKSLGIIASLLHVPSLGLNASLTLPNGKIVNKPDELCVITELTAKTSDPVYGPAMKSIYAADHMVLIFAKTTLEEGKHSVVIKEPNQADITWSFTVLAPPQATKSSISPNKGELSWESIKGSELNPVTGYIVEVNDKYFKPVMSFPTVATSMNFDNMQLGEDLSGYIFCVSVQTRVHITKGASCVYGPGARVSQTLIISPTLTNNSISVGQSFYVRSNKYVTSFKINLLTPDVCQATTGENDVNVKIVGLASGVCNFKISNDGSYFVKEISQDFSIKVTAPVKSTIIGNSKIKLRSITCINKNQTRTITGMNPVCPKGFKLKS